MIARELIIDLNQEQGKGRESQVQPPLEVWEQFFGFRPGVSAQPTFRLQNLLRPTDPPEQRKVVKHHHNFTLEVGGAKFARPATLTAILRMRLTGPNAFDYWVYKKPSAEFRHCNWCLEHMGLTAKGGRRYLII